MFDQPLMCLSGILLVVTPFVPSNSELISSLLLPLDVKCDHAWHIKENIDAYELDRLSAADECLSFEQNKKTCIGIKCNSSTSNCKLILQHMDDLTKCISSHTPMEEKLVLRSEFVDVQANLAMVELEIGQLVIVSEQGHSPISIPPTYSTRLQTQWMKDFLVCSEDSTQCQLWNARSNQWNKFPRLNIVHDGGSLNVVGNKPILVGGKDDLDNDHGVVEIYDKNTDQWILGPDLFPVRRTHSSVVIYDYMLVIVGGYDGTLMTSVKVMDIHTMNWYDLNDLPTGRCMMVCGVLYLNAILCLGGEEDDALIVDSAYVLDMGLWHPGLGLNQPSWIRQEHFDTKDPVRGGFIFQLQNHLFCMTLRTTGYETSRELRRMNLTEETPQWESLAKYSDSMFPRVSPYKINGYRIQP